jgi:hypothetical protein
MNVWRVIIIAAALAPFLVECTQQPEGPAAEHGLCYQQPSCEGATLPGLPTKEQQCKATGGQSWLGGAAQYCSGRTAQAASSRRRVVVLAGLHAGPSAAGFGAQFVGPR